MSQLDMSRIDSQNLPFYMHDYDEQKCNFITFRLKGNLDYSSIISSDFSQNEFQLSDQFEQYSNDLQNLSFFIRTCNLILSNADLKSFNQKTRTILDIYEAEHSAANLTTSVSSRLQKFIPVELLKKVSASNEPSENYSPLFTNHKGVCHLQNTFIPIDCLVLVDSNTKLDNLFDILLEKLNLHFQAIKQCYLKYYQKEDNFVPETYHYCIDNQINSNTSNLIVTCIYPSNLADDALLNLRQEIHKILELPLDRALIRRIDSFEFSPDTSALSNTDLAVRYLQNPHTSAKPSNVQNGKQSLVYGNYIYFHYMQDGFNDNGWGCAYRSFQTIFSWYRLQGYTQKPIPRHSEIQQALVDLEDKPKSFVGSSKWIGSMEISFCLSKLLNVESRVLFVNKGSEIADKARELQYHFETEGTPIMIGGGVLAHTIIGVDFDELTGNIKYLILDPHYTGSEDIKTITSKGWVGWKDNKFWDEKSYYNMCLPIKPRGV